jgi:hypothetical protein
MGDTMLPAPHAVALSNTSTHCCDTVYGNAIPTAAAVRTQLCVQVSGWPHLLSLQNVAAAVAEQAGKVHITGSLSQGRNVLKTTHTGLRWGAILLANVTFSPVTL